MRVRTGLAVALAAAIVGVSLAGCSGAAGLPGTSVGIGSAIPTGKAVCDWSSPVIRNNEYSQQFHAVTFANSASGVQLLPNGNSTLASCEYVPVYSGDGESVTDVSAQLTVNLMSSSVLYDDAKTNDASGQGNKDNWDGYDIYTDLEGDEYAQVGPGEYLGLNMVAGVGDDTVESQEVSGFLHDMMYNLLDLWKAGKHP